MKGFKREPVYLNMKNPGTRKAVLV